MACEAGRLNARVVGNRNLIDVTLQLVMNASRRGQPGLRPARPGPAPPTAAAAPCTSFSLCTAAPKRRGTFALSTFILLCFQGANTASTLGEGSAGAAPSAAGASPCPAPLQPVAGRDQEQTQPLAARATLPAPTPAAAAACRCQPPLRAPPPLHVQTNAQQTLL